MTFKHQHVSDTGYPVLKDMATYLAERGLGLIQGYGIIAGGACRALIARGLGRQEEINDLDMYFCDHKSFIDTWQFIEGKASLKAVKEIDDAKLMSYQTSIGKIDLIKQFVPQMNGIPATLHGLANSRGGAIERLLKDFHFTVAAAGIDNKCNICVHENCIEDISDKRLRLINPQSSVRLILAAQKYIQRGYALDVDAAYEVAVHIASLGITKIKCDAGELKARNGKSGSA
jgi:hypothetical protein